MDFEARADSLGKSDAKFTSEMFLEIPDAKKQEILADLQAIPIDDYFDTAQAEAENDPQDSSEAV